MTPYVPDGGAGGYSTAVGGTSPVRLASLVAIASLLAYLPVLTTALLGTPAGWGTVLLVGAILVALRYDLEALTGAIAPTSALTLSGLVQGPSQYMALSAVAGALFVRFFWAQRQHLPAALLPRVSRPIQLLLAAYLAWAAVTTALSTDHRLSLVYLAGMLFALSLAFVVVPQVLATRDQRLRFLGAIVGTGIVAVAVSVVLGLIGPIRVFGVPFGSVLFVEPLVLQHPTGLVYARAFGPYVDQGPYYTLLAIGILAAVALRAESRGAGRWVFAIATAILVAFELGSFARGGWLMVAAGGCLWAGARLLLGRRDWFGTAVAALFVVSLGAVLMNSVGAIARFDVQTQHGWPAYLYAGKLAYGFGDIKNGQIKGGSSLTERQYLWGASISAIKLRPLTGFGPGTDATAIAPFMTDGYVIYRGVSSHSGWLRTGVEMGVPGLLLDACIWAGLFLSVLVVIWRRRGATPLEPIILAAIVLAFLTDQFFEVYLLGGLGLPNLVCAMAMGLLAVAVAAPAQAELLPAESAAGDGDGSGSRATTMMPSPQKGVVR